MTVRAFVTVALLVLPAAGCSGLHSNLKATQVYSLALPTAAPAPQAGAALARPISDPAAGLTLLLPRPLAAPGLDSERLALSRGARLDYYAASAWPAALPELVQALALDALRATGRYRAVQTDASALVADRVLQLEIRRCAAEYHGDGAPTVHVQLVATLGQRSDRSLVSSLNAESAVAADGNRMQSVVAAFQAAMADALNQIATGLPATP